MHWTRRISVLHAWWFVMLMFLVVFGLNILLDDFTHALAGDVIPLVYFGFYGLYCLQNYLGCRAYHCLITGPGFIFATVLMLLRVTGFFDHSFGIPYIVFALTLVIGHGLEWRYWKRTGRRFRCLTAGQSQTTHRAFYQAAHPGCPG
jgi:hypothetical protein